MIVEIIPVFDLIIEAEWMIKILIKLFKKHSNPWHLESSNPFLQLVWRITK